ncbi:MAG: YicC family protein [Magnetococcus sp. THC-1_WYH]
MLQSMTGYGQAEAVFEGVRILWRLKSVNHRYLDLSFRLPDGMEALEVAAGTLLKEYLSRGHIDGYLSLSVDGGEGGLLDLNRGLLKDLLAFEKRLMGEVGERRPMDLGVLLGWPGMVRERRVDVAGKLREGRLGQAVLDTLGLAAQSLREVREREGERTGVVLSQLLEELRGTVAQASGRLPELRVVMKERLRTRLEDWLTTAVDENRFMQELAVLYNRMELSEELDRLVMHCQEVVKIMELGQPMGRRLDFLCQELGREANTLCSKSQDGQLSRWGVEMKVTIEKMREQVQNLE